MDIPLLAASVLISLGAAIMLVNIIGHRLTIQDARKVVDVQRRQTRILIRVHHVLMFFFFISYIGILYLFINKIQIASSLFVAVIFFFGAIFVFMGIVIQKRMFDLLQSKNEHLEKERYSLTLLNDQLKEEVQGRLKAETSDQMKSDFLSLVSHELRTPLTSIYGFSQLMCKGVTSLDNRDDEQVFEKKKKRLADNLHIVNNECRRLTRLVNNVLDLEKIESGQMDWVDEKISVNKVVENSMNALAGVLSQHRGVSIKVDIAEDIPSVVLDADLFTQVIINIVNNAIKFTDEGEVKLKAWLRDEGLRISIADEGRGIPHEHLESIFDKFYVVRAGDTLGEKRQGTGLGLPICKQIIAHYDGRIWAESVLGKGSVFHMLLPNKVYSAD